MNPSGLTPPDNQGGQSVSGQGPASLSGWNHLPCPRSPLRACPLAPASSHLGPPCPPRRESAMAGPPSASASSDSCVNVCPKVKQLGPPSQGHRAKTKSPELAEGGTAETWPLQPQLCDPQPVASLSGLLSRARARRDTLPGPLGDCRRGKTRLDPDPRSPSPGRGLCHFPQTYAARPAGGPAPAFSYAIVLLASPGACSPQN